MNTIETIRIKLGLSKPQVLKLLKLKPSALRYFYLPDEQIDPAIIRNMQRLEMRYNVWAKMIMESVKAEAPVSVTRLSQILQISPLTLWGLARKQLLPVIPATEQDRRQQYAVGVEEVEHLFGLNQNTLKRPRAETAKLRGPLAEAFVRHLLSGEKVLV